MDLIFIPSNFRSNQTPPALWAYSELCDGRCWRHPETPLSPDCTLFLYLAHSLKWVPSFNSQCKRHVLQWCSAHKMKELPRQRLSICIPKMCWRCLTTPSVDCCPLLAQQILFQISNRASWQPWKAYFNQLHATMLGMSLPVILALTDKISRSILKKENQF